MGKQKWAWASQSKQETLVYIQACWRPDITCPPVIKAMMTARLNSCGDNAVWHLRQQRIKLNSIWHYSKLSHLVRIPRHHPASLQQSFLKWGLLMPAVPQTLSSSLSQDFSEFLLPLIDQDFYSALMQPDRRELEFLWTTARGNPLSGFSTMTAGSWLSCFPEWWL